MGVIMLIDKLKLRAKVNSAWKEARAKVAEEILNDCNEYCKRDRGDLIKSSLIHSKPKRGKLVWQTPYAKRQYWEIETAYTDENPNASWKWCEVAKQNHRERWERQAQAYFKQALSGRGVTTIDLSGGTDE